MDCSDLQIYLRAWQQEKCCTETVTDNEIMSPHGAVTKEVGKYVNQDSKNPQSRVMNLAGAASNTPVRGGKTELARSSTSNHDLHELFSQQISQAQPL